jgi:hypothetical protein
MPLQKNNFLSNFEEVDRGHTIFFLSARGGATHDSTPRHTCFQYAL